MNNTISLAHNTISLARSLSPFLFLLFAGNYNTEVNLMQFWCIAIEQELEAAIYKAGGIRESNYGNLNKISWARSSRTDKGVNILNVFVVTHFMTSIILLVVLICFIISFIFKVHSLATTITLKMEIPESAWMGDPCGILLANYINFYLPDNIKVFGIVPSQRWVFEFFSLVLLC